MNAKTNHKKTQAYMPLLLTVLGLCVIGLAAVYCIFNLKTTSGQAMGGAAFALYLLWVFWEMNISVGELKKEEAPHDHNTMEISAAVKLLLLMVLFTTTGVVSIPAGAIGITVMVTGIMLRSYAIKTLGRAYTHRIRELSGSPITEGPYRAVRHPAYLGTLLAHTGLVLVFLNPWSLLALLLWYIVVIIRTGLEDSLLMHSNHYRSYAEKVKWRLFPGIW